MQVPDSGMNPRFYIEMLRFPRAGPINASRQAIGPEHGLRRINSDG